MGLGWFWKALKKTKDLPTNGESGLRYGRDRLHGYGYANGNRIRIPPPPPRPPAGGDPNNNPYWPTNPPPTPMFPPLWPSDIRELRRYQDAQKTNPYPHCPLILDFNRDGNLGLNATAFFDLTANGFHELTAWLDETNAFLVLDKHGTGQIKNGSQMFGHAMVLPNGMTALSGWDALRFFDSNGNGKIDVNDEIFASLGVLTGDGRFYSLADAGIVSITLPPPLSGDNHFLIPERGPGGPGPSVGIMTNGYGWVLINGKRHTFPIPNQATWNSFTRAEQDQFLIDQGRAIRESVRENGGTFGQSSVITWADGTTSQIKESFPYRVPMFSIPAEVLEVPYDIAALPDLMGFGNKHDLHQAIVRDESGALRDLLEQFMAETNPVARERIFQNLLFEWAGVAEVAPRSRGHHIDARRIAFLEVFFGEDFRGASGANPDMATGPMMDSLFNDIMRGKEMSLLAQTHLRPLFENMGYDFTEPVLNPDGSVKQQGVLNISFDPAIAWLADLMNTDLSKAMKQIWGLQRIFGDTAMELRAAMDRVQMENELRAGYMAKMGRPITIDPDTPERRAYLEFMAFKDSLREVMYEHSPQMLNFFGENFIFGSAGNGTVRGIHGQDNVIVGGQGDDLKIGGTGRNTYVWSPGDGNDTINDFARDKDANAWGGTLKIGGGVDPAAVELTRVGNNLILIIAETGERLTIHNWFRNTDYQLLQIKFGDGTVWVRDEINEMTIVLRATSDNGQIINGCTANNNIIHGSDGGNDTLRGNGGHNVLIGGRGDDLKIAGGPGRNTYIWEPGDGNDTINDFIRNKDAGGWGGTLKIGKGVDPANVELTRAGNNLILIIAETGERLTIHNWFRNTDYQLLQIKFGDGTVWVRDEINEMTIVLRATSDNGQIINGSTANNNIIHGSDGGNDTLRGNGGHNVLIGGRGDDLKIAGGPGRNTYIWEPGDGNDTINDFIRNKDADGWGGTLKIGEGVDPTGVTTARVGNNLVLTIGETGERLTIQDWFRGADWQLNRIEFADGTYWNRSSGQSVEAFFQEQAEMAAASELLMPQSASLFSFGCDISLTSSFEMYNDATAANPAAFINDQTVVDVALACLQIETDSGMVCSTENASSSMNSASALAISSGNYTQMYEEQFSSRHVA